MLNSVPIDIGGEKYLLQFSAIDVDEMESLFDKPLVSMLNENQIKRIGVLGTMLYAGLKKNGLPGPHGELPRVFPRGAAGRADALDLVRTHTTGKTGAVMIELGNKIFEGFGAGEWFTFKAVLENEAVPQETEPSKNSQGTGSSP
jgi:hypothetical protein